MAPQEEIKVTVGCGNVFADMGLPDAEEAFVKAQLASRIDDIIAKRRLTLALAAELLGVGEPRTLSLNRGRFRDFSVGQLLRFLTALDDDIDIVVRPKAAEYDHGHLKFVVQS